MFASSVIRPAAAERENVIQLLAIALAEGRLNTAEFELRVDAAYTAASDADLGRLLIDLPAPPSLQTPLPPRRGWAVLAHLLGLAIPVLAPLAIARGRHSEFVRDQALEAANFQLTVLLACCIVPIAALFTLGIGLVLWIPLTAGWLWYSVAAALAARRGERYRYPINLRLIAS